MYIDDYKVVNRSFWEKLFSLNWEPTKKIKVQKWVRITPHPTRVSDAKILTSTERAVLAAHSAQKLNEKQRLVNAAKRTRHPVIAPAGTPAPKKDDDELSVILLAQVAAIRSDDYGCKPCN